MSRAAMKGGKPESYVLKIHLAAKDEVLKGFLACGREITALVIDSRDRYPDFLNSDYFYFVLGDKPNIFWVDISLGQHSLIKEEFVTEKLRGLRHNLIIQCGTVNSTKAFVKEPGKDVVILDLNDPQEQITEDDLLVKLLQKDCFGVPLLVEALKLGLIGEFNDKPNSHRSLTDVTLGVEKAFGRKNVFNPDLSVVDGAATLLDYAVFHNNFLCTRLLWSLSSHEWNLFAPNDKDLSTLEIAAKHAGPDVLAVLLDIRLPLKLSRVTVNEEAVRLLDPSRYCEKSYPLLAAVRKGREDNVKFFLQCGVEFNTVDENGKGALDYAVVGKRWGIVKNLVGNGACVGRLTFEEKVDVLRNVTGSDLTIDDKDFDRSVCKNLYGTLRINSVQLLETLDRKWREDCGNDPGALRRIDKCLRKVYEELRWKRVTLSDEMEAVIESRLMNLDFLVENKGKDVTTSLDNVKFRMEEIVRCVGEMRKEYAGRDVDEKFLFKAQFVACNIRVLKRRLKSTFDKLPWEEMEFCIVIFITSLTKHGEFDVVYKLVLDKERLLSHLGNFSEELDKVRQRIAGKDVNSKFPDQVDKIRLAANPLFAALYSDHALMRNVYSLRRVESYVNVALSVDIEAKPELGKLVIERTLQIVGESLKNSLDSPNVSEDVQCILLYSAPKNVKEIVTVLRDSLSHSHTLAKKISFEEGKDLGFFLAMQNDLRKIGLHIGKVLYGKKSDAIDVFANKMISCENLTDIQKLAGSVDRAEFDRFGSVCSGGNGMTELGKLKELIRQLEDIVEELDIAEKESFRELEAIVNSQESILGNARSGYLDKLCSMNDTIENGLKRGQGASTIRNVCLFYLYNHRPLKEKELSDIYTLLKKICSKVNVKDGNKRLLELVLVVQRLWSTIELEGHRIHGIGGFKETLEFKGGNLRRNAEEVLDGLLRAVQETLGGAGGAFTKKVEVAKGAWTAKMELSALFQREVKNGIVSLDDSTVYQSLNAKTKEKFRKAFDNGELGRCKEILEGKDSYQTLLNSVRNCLQNEQHDMTEHFAEFANSTKPSKALKESLHAAIVATFKAKGQMQSYFDKRLEILGRLLPSDAVEAVVLCKQDKGLLIAVEMLVLDLSELLDSMGLFADNRLFLDRYSPLLMGKVLRNYLAHGDALVDCLPFDPSTSVVLSAVRLISEGKALLTTKDRLIGRVMMENNGKLIERYVEGVALASNQDKMIEAAKMGDLKQVKAWVREGTDVKARDFDGRTALHLAAQSNDLITFQFFLDENVDTEAKDYYGKTCVDIAEASNSTVILKRLTDFVGTGRMSLHVAAKFGIENAAIVFIKEGIDVNSRDEDGMTPIMLSAARGHFEVVRLLAENGGEVDGLTGYGETPMHLAAQNGHVKVMEALLAHGANVNAVTKTNWAPLHFAVKYGHNGCVECLVERGAVLDITTSETWLPLHIAAMHGSSEVMQAFLKKGADVDAVSKGDVTPLHNAAAGGFKEALVALLDKGATVDVKSVEWYTPLHYAAAYGHKDVTVILLERGADRDCGTNKNETALHLAALKGHNEVVKALLRGKADADARNKNGETALHFAALRGFQDVVKSLLEFNAALNVKDDGESMTPLHYATRNGQARMVPVLLENGAEINALSKKGGTALHLAATHGYKDIAKALLDNKADINAVNQAGKKALDLAAYFGHRNIVELLLERGAQLGVGRADDWSTLHHAARNGLKEIVLILLPKSSCADKESAFLAAAENGHSNVVDALLKEKIDVNARNSLGSTALCCAARNGYKEMVMALIENGADVRTACNDGKTALHLASWNGHNEIVDILLKRGAVDVPNVNKVTALHMAAEGGHRDVVENLLKNGSRVNAVNGDLLTVLHFAAGGGHTSVAEVLLNNGADVMAKMTADWRPLHLAAYNGHTGVTDLLLRNGADVEAQAKDGWTALYFAVKNGCEGVVEILLKNGGNVLSRNYHSTVLHESVHGNNVEVVRVILDRIKQVLGGDPEVVYEWLNAGDRDGDTPLMWAVEKGYLDAVRVLLEYVDIGCRNKSGMTALHWAAKYGNLDIVKLLLEAGGCVKDVDCEGKSVLYYAALSKDLNVVKFLVEAGAEVTAQDSMSVHDS